MTLNIEHYSIKPFAFVFTASVIIMLLQNFITNNAIAKSFWQGSTGSQVLFDNNYYKTNADKISEQTLQLTPSATISIQQPLSRLNFSYAGIYGVNRTISSENQQDNTVSSGINIKFTDVSSFSFNAKFQTSRDKRGVSTTPVTSNRPLAIWSGKTSSASGTIPFVSTSKLHISGEFQERLYESTYASSSRNILKINVATILPLTFKTSFQIKYSRQTLSYHSDSTKNSEINRIFGGVNWKTTNKTTSFANFGLENNSRSQSGGIYSGLYADISFKWRRKSYSIIDFKLSRKTTDTGNIVDGYLVSNSMSINWNHKFPRKWRVSVGSGTKLDQFESGRRDALINPSIKLTFARSKFFHYNTSLVTTKRESNRSLLNYDNFVFSAGIDLKIGSR